MEHKSIVDLKKVIDNYGMYENYAEEDNVGYDENGNRLHTGCMGEDFVYMVQDGLIERDSLTTFGEIIRGKKPGRESDDEIILVSIEGMPTEDVAWAYECYTYALVHASGRSGAVCSLLGPLPSLITNQPSSNHLTGSSPVSLPTVV